jgi:Predicted membrane protein
VSLLEWPARIRDFLTHQLWEIEPERRSRLSAIRLLQFSIMLVEGFVRDRLLLRASALSYFTVISLVPLLAVVVAIANSIGIGSAGFIDWLVGTISAGAPGAAGVIRALIERVNFTGFGTLGGAVLFLTTVLGLGTVESSLNDVWGVPSGRGFARRFADYLAVLVVAPVLGGLALSFGSSVQAHLPGSLPALPFATDSTGVWLPVAMLSGAFTFLYWFLPNASVRVVSAAIGGVFAGLMVTLAQSAYVHWSIGVARADVFFGGFALLPLLFAWIYVFWGIVLLGAEIAFAHQNFALYRQEVRSDPATPAEREAIALQISLEVARCFGAGMPAPIAAGLADELQVPVRTVRSVAAQLVDAGILSTREATIPGQDPGFQLGRPAEAISGSDVLAAVRGQRKTASKRRATAVFVEKLLAEIEDAAHKGAGDRTLADLLHALPPAPIDPPATRG